MANKQNRSIESIQLFFRLAWRVSPSYVLLLVLQSILGSGQIFMNVILPKYLIDELLGSQRMPYVIAFGIAIVLSNALFVLINQSMKRVMDEKNEYVRNHMSVEMAKKIMNVEFSYLENPYYLDLKERAIFALNNQNAMGQFITNLASLLKEAITILGLIAIMMTLSWILVVGLMATIVLSLLVYRAFMGEQMKYFQKIIPINRRYGYYVSLFFENRFQKDIRLYHMAPMLLKRVRQYGDEINEEFKLFYRKQGWIQGGYGAINDLQTVIAYAYVGLRTITDALGPRIGIGSFSMYVSTAIQFSRAIGTCGENIMTLVQTLGYLEPFMEFMKLPEESDLGGQAPIDEIEHIEFDHVSFQYPGSNTVILNDVSFSIQKGEKISIVGLNGAGKTTLIKLLCRLYRPTSGTIKINGQDIFAYDHVTYMKQIAAIFQDYKLFAFSIKENIIGNQDMDDEAIAHFLHAVGMKEKVEKLPEGVASKFGKAYDEKGIEMSGGEGQKIAIARALAKQASLIILDEPTSALDPLAEAEIYQNFNELVGSQTAIYISHRMSSSVFCDKILIIDHGTVSGYDSHEALMKRNDSLYYELFTAQAVNYQLD